MQLKFGDAEGLGKRKQARREIFLAETGLVVPPKALLAQIHPITRGRAVWADRRMRWRRCCASTCSSGMH